jgi:hypothetical protein
LVIFWRNIFLGSIFKTYAYDTGNNLTNLSHQANSGNWQQTLIIHSNNNRGTQTQQSTNDFDVLVRVGSLFGFVLGG